MADRPSVDRQRSVATRDLRLGLVSLWCLAIVAPILDLLGDNPAYFVAQDHGLLEVVAFVVILSTAPGPVVLLLLGLSRVAGPMLERWSLAAACTLLAVVSAVQTMRLIQPGLWVAGPALAVVLIVFYVKNSHFRAFVSILAVTTILVPLLFFAKLNDRGSLKPAILDSAPETQTTAPIVVLLLDEFALPSVLTDDWRIDEEIAPNLSRLAAQSDWYRNAIAAADSTDWAVPAMFSTGLASRETSPSVANFPNNLFTLFSDYRIFAREPITALCPRSLNQLTRDGNVISRLRTALVDSAVLLAHQVSPPSLQDRLPPVSSSWGDFALGAANAVRFDEDDLHDGGRIRRFRSYLEKLDDQDRTIWFYHLLMPHVPWQYLASGRTYPTDTMHIQGLGSNEKWLEDQQAVENARERYLQQVRFTDSLVGEFLDGLVDAGLFDKAVVVVVADHGVAFQAGGWRRIHDDSNFDEVLRVPLFIKSPQQSSGNTVEETFPTRFLLGEIAQRVGQPLPWQYDKQDVLFANRWRSATLTDLQRRPPPKRMTLAEPPANDLIGEALSDLLLENRVAIGHGTFRLSRTDRLFAYRKDSQLVPALLEGVIDDRSDSQAYAVAINGVIVDTFFTGPLESTGDSTPSSVVSSRPFATLLPETAFSEPVREVLLLRIVPSTAGHHTVERLSETLPQALTLVRRRLAGVTELQLGTTGGSRLTQNDQLAGVVEQYSVLRDSTIVAGWVSDSSIHRESPDVLLFANDELISRVTPTAVRTDVLLDGNDKQDAFAFRFEVPAYRTAKAEMRVFAVDSDSGARRLSERFEVLETKQGLTVQSVLGNERVHARGTYPARIDIRPLRVTFDLSQICSRRGSLPAKLGGYSTWYVSGNSVLSIGPPLGEITRTGEECSGTVPIRFALLDGIDSGEISFLLVSENYGEGFHFKVLKPNSFQYTEDSDDSDLIREDFENGFLLRLVRKRVATHQTSTVPTQR